MSLLQENVAFKPFAYPWAMEYAVKHEEVHWGEWEVKLQDDVTQWQTKITTQEKDHITQILRLFTQSDVAVGRNYLEHYIPKFKKVRQYLHRSDDPLHEKGCSGRNEGWL